VTEALWAYLKEACLADPQVYTPEEGWAEDLMIAKWPEPMDIQGYEDDYLRGFGLVQDISRAIRNLRSEYKIEPHKKLKAVMVSGEMAEFLEEQMAVIADFANLDLDALQVSAAPLDVDGLTALVVDRVEIFLELTSEADDEADRERLTKELQEAESHIKRLEGLLASPFAQKAPEHVVAAERAKLEDYKATAEKLRERLA
jgi:valyl-tRNA synthetase